MSTEIGMAPIINLLFLLFSATLVCYHQSKVPLTSFKIGGNVTYDCIDIYKQPGLDHPLLKTHKIQMKSSFSRHEAKNLTGNNKTYKKLVGCPDGTVPIMRNTKEFIVNSQLFAKKYLLPLSADSPGTHLAGIRSRAGPFHGVEAWFNGYNLNIGKDQTSYNQIYIGSRSNNNVNFISAGFMINPSLFGDGRLWSFGFWKGKNGNECYNTACPGFVQVSKEISIVKPFDNLKPGEPEWLRYSIHEDKNTGNWWLIQLIPNVPHNEDIGYWPKELFNIFDNGANMVGVGGAVQASRSGLSPAMGNGKFPDARPKSSAIFTNIEVLNSNYQRVKMNSFPIEKLVDSTKCFGLRIGNKFLFQRNRQGFYFNYGGPGGNSCGI